MFFALLAAFLVGIGLYGTMAYRVNRKKVEIGVRMAMGAQRSQVFYLVLRETFQIAVLGTAAGIPIALIVGHFMCSMLYELQPYDRLSLVAALLGIAGVSLVAGLIPAHRAASINPVQALRSE
jgi:ABC-type antimicrobial peptide transport system permease subunit